jgi:hypothetical protein
MANMTETYKRVCTRKEGHDGEHLPYYLTPDKDEFGNKEVQQPRCMHVVPIPIEQEEERFRVIFDIIDPRYPQAGWHEVAKEHDTLESAIDQRDGLQRLMQEGEDVSFTRIERLVSRWELIEE